MRFDPEKITFGTGLFKTQGEYEFFKDLVEKKKGKKDLKFSTASAMKVEFDVVDSVTPFELDTDQSYQLKVVKGAHDDLDVLITARNVFGARYALVTLSQLVVFDDFRNEMLVRQSELPF